MLKHRLAIGSAAALLAAGIILPVGRNGVLAGTGTSSAEFNGVGNLDKPITIDLHDLPAVKALGLISEASGVEIRTEGNTNCCLVSVKLANLPAGQGLELIAQQSGIRFEVVSSKSLRAIFPGASETDTKLPELVNKVEAVYPNDAMKAGAEGFVVVAAKVGTDGAVNDVDVVRHADGWPSMDQAAADAVRQFTYKPAMKDGKPVAFEMHVKIVFSLSKGTEEIVKTSR